MDCTISIHAPIVGCDNIGFSLVPNFDISIHAPIVGCDPVTACIGHFRCYFNPRTHRGVRPFLNVNDPSRLTIFQSTHPSWGATVTWSVSTSVKASFQSTHPSWGATTKLLHSPMPSSISIHAPIVGCDTQADTTDPICTPFQSTHPSWGATR